jgi:hypothetical protein
MAIWRNKANFASCARCEVILAGGAFNVLAFIRKSFMQNVLPDLFCFALVGDFRGYYPGYSKRFANTTASLGRF